MGELGEVIPYPTDPPASVFDTGSGTSVDTTSPFGQPLSVRKDSPAPTIDSYFTTTPEQIEQFKKSQTEDVETKIGIDAANERARASMDADLRQRQESAMRAEGATMQDLHPWNSDLESARTTTNLWDKFGSPGFVLGMIASSFTAYPMTSALNAGAAAMNAINEGDMEAYHRHFDSWKEFTNLTLKRLDIEEKAFNQLENLRSSNLADWRAKAEATLAQFNDQRKLALLNAGMDSEVIAALDTQVKLRKDLAQSQVDIQNNNARMQVFNEYLQRHPGDFAGAATHADEVMTNPTTLEGAAQKAVVTAPGFHDKDYKTQVKELADAAKEIYEARYSSRGSITQQQAAADMNTIKAEVREKHKDDPNWTEADTIKEARKELALSSSRSIRSASAMAATKYMEENPKATAADVTAFSSAYTSAVARARTLGVRGANIDTAVTDLYKTAQLAVNASNKVPRGNWVPITEIQQSILKGISRPEMRVFFDANAAVITAYSQAITRSGGTTVHAQSRADELLNTADGPEAYKAGLHQLQLEAQANQAAVRDVEAGKIIGTDTDTSQDNPMGLDIK